MLYQFFDPVRVASSDFQLSNYRPIFTRLSNYFGGLEIEQAFEVMSHFGACDDLASFEKTKTEFPIIDVEKSVNPELWKILGTLQQIEIDIRELHKKDDPIVKWFDKGFPQTTLANGEVD
jgi:hypothetical protein